MKIAQLISTYLPIVGGAQICVHNVAQRHVNSGHDVVLITPRRFKKFSSGQYGREFLAPATVALFKYSYPLAKFCLLFQVHRLQKKYRFDLWQVSIGFPFAAALADYFKQHKIPCVLRCSGEDIQCLHEAGYGVRLNEKADRLIRQNYPKFDAVVAISTAMVQEYKNLGIPEEKIYKFPNGVDIARFQAGQNRMEIRKQLGLPADKKVILTVGRNHPKKGFRFIPPMIKMLSQKRDDFVWLLVGPGHQSIHDLASEIKVEDRLIIREASGLKDKQDEYPAAELIEIYQACDLFVFPTLLETFGIVVVEAMAAGLPVVTTTAPGVDDLVEDYFTGFKSSSGDMTAMVNRIQQIFNDPQLNTDLRTNVLNESRKYDWNIISQLYLHLYKNLVKEEAVPIRTTKIAAS